MALKAEVGSGTYCDWRVLSYIGSNTEPWYTFICTKSKYIKYRNRIGFFVLPLGLTKLD